MFSNKKESYHIAEIGVNHGGDIKLAKSMIDQVARAGGDAVKFQTYKADKIAVKDSPAYWDLSAEPTTTQHELFKKYDQFDQSEYIELAKYANSKNIQFCSTPFDLDCVDWLMELQPFCKIASADLTNQPLLNRIAEHGRPMILSVGAATDFEIERSLNYLINKGVPSIVLMHCMLLYPTPLEYAYLSEIDRLMDMFSSSNVTIGYSDHVSPNEANNDQIICAASKGVRIFEKHFTYDRTLSGNDHYHADDEETLTSTIKRVNSIIKMTDNDSKKLERQASAIKNARRGVYFSHDISSGKTLEEVDFICKRPANGIDPFEITNYIGKTLNSNVNCDQPFTKNLIS